MVNTCKLIYIALFICFKFNYFVFVSYVDLTRLTETKGFSGGSAGKESAGNIGDLVLIAGWEDSLEKGQATNPSILSWRIPWTV